VTNRPFCKRITVGIISALTAIALHAQSKPTREHELFIESPPGPGSISELFDKSTIVVAGIVISEHPADHVATNLDPRERVTPLVQTNYSIRVTEFFKNSGSGRGTDVVIQMLLPGGRRDRGSFVEDFADRSLPTPELGQEYVLFLRLETSSLGSHFVPTMGFQESVFLLTTQGRVVPRGRGAVASSFSGALATSFKDVLRKQGRKL